MRLKVGNHNCSLWVMSPIIESSNIGDITHKLLWPSLVNFEVPPKSLVTQKSVVSHENIVVNQTKNSDIYTHENMN